ncbi:MAG: Glu/Leu/Phe/Val dehydrogenase [Patescibacteria group bacterium]
MQNPYQNAMAQLDKVAKIKKFPNKLIARLKTPDRNIKIEIPVKMDDGKVKTFEGYRVQYNNALGPYKGGVRYHPDTEINEVKALAFWMTLKCAVAGIPMGGGKGGITVEPKDLSKGELERLSRGWVRGLADVLGPHKDVPAPDVNTTPEIMAWMADEFGKITGDTSGTVITGKPLDKGGSEGRNTSTAQGGFYAFESLKNDLNLPKKCTVVIQGFGNVGSHAASIWHKTGHKIIAISESKGGIYNPDGIDVGKLAEYKKTTGTISDFPGSKNITNVELLATECDLLIPAAFENEINETNADNVKTKAILELANGPTTPEADEILFKKNIPVLPDIWVNGGGVIVSYFEWEQNLKGEHWSEKEVFAKLKTIMEEAAKEISEKAKQSKTSLRMGAFILALERIAKKM